MTIFLRNISGRSLTLPNMTTPNSTISEPYKHLRIANAFMVRQITPWRKRRLWVWSVSDASSRIRVWAALPS